MLKITYSKYSPTSRPTIHSYITPWEDPITLVLTIFDASKHRATLSIFTDYPIIHPDAYYRPVEDLTRQHMSDRTIKNHRGRMRYIVGGILYQDRMNMTKARGIITPWHQFASVAAAANPPEPPGPNLLIEHVAGLDPTAGDDRGTPYCMFCDRSLHPTEIHAPNCLWVWANNQQPT